MFKFHNRKLSGYLKLAFCIILMFKVSYVDSVTQEKNGDENNKIRTVVIDPGHGGKDSGALGKFSMEKDVVLAIALKLGKFIEENIPDVKVVYTRTTDVFIPLYQRAEIANKCKADLFISIHANSNTSPEPFGASTHVLGLHRADENFEVAKRENSVILMEDDYTVHYENFDPNSPESYIIFTLMQNVYFDQSINFASMVQNQFRERAKRKDRGVIQQGLLVLAQTSMPGVLIETGFISNPTEEKYLNSDMGQDYIASAIYRAFKNYKSMIEMNSSNITDIANEENSDSSVEKQESAEPVVKQDTSDTDSIKNIIASSFTKTKSNVENNIYYKVQISSSANHLPLDSDIFKSFEDIEEFQVDSIYKYAVGKETSYNDIVDYSKKVKKRYPDAFIIAVKNGKIISIQEAINDQNK